MSELATALRLRQANVSQHLALMRQRGVLVERRVGNSVFYHIVDKRIIDAYDLIQAVLLDQMREDMMLVRATRRG